jgi:uncharacterized membrane protein YeiH
LLAVLGGIGGGVVRDILLNVIPAALTNPFYLITCLLTALIALRISQTTSVRLQSGLFLVMGCFSLAWYAIVGSQKALATGLPYLAVIVIGVVGPTARPYVLDLTCGMTPSISATETVGRGQSGTGDKR